MELRKVENLSKAEVKEITTKIGEAFAGENEGIVKAVGNRQMVQEYMRIAAEVCYKSKCLYTLDGTGYVAFYHKDQKPPIRYHFWMAYEMFKTLGYKNTMQIMGTLKGWVGYEKLYKNESDYLVLYLLAIFLEYQGQGRMKPLVHSVFEQAKKAGIACVLDTDAEIKKKKYLACGMTLDHTEALLSGITVYTFRYEGACDNSGL